MARAIPLLIEPVTRKRSGEIWTESFDVRADLNRVSRSPGGLRRTASIDPMRLAPLRFEQPSERHAPHRPISFRMLDRTDKHQHHHR